MNTDALSMGPDVAWLTRALAPAAGLRPGMRVMDLGCGKAVSSLILAREHDVRVWAVDLWIPASDNWQRVTEAGEDRVFPVHAEAHALPFADGFFEAIVSVDSYHYFGTDDLYLAEIIRFLRPGGRLAIVVPGMTEELEAMPEDWDWDWCSFHSPAWWRRHWAKTRLVDVEHCAMVPGGREMWEDWNRRYPHHTDERVLRHEGMGFVSVVATRR